MQLTSTRRAEVAMAVLAIALAGAFLYDGRALAPGVLEPVGPGSIPNATCWIVIALSLAMLMRSVRGGGSGQASASVSGERWRDLGFLVVAVSAYVALLGFGVVRYSIATTVFLALSIVWLAPHRRRAWPGALAVGVVLGFGLDYVFRHVLITDLP
ncbi:MAG: tripartite tricarboxylate transporter TctB family protein [Casimicrobiaceae bacterium]